MACVAHEAFAARLRVHLNEDALMRLPARVATIVIGNPSIADVSVQRSGFIVITGKGYGMTNLIVLDSHGAVLAAHSIEVLGPHEVTTVYFGTARRTFSSHTNMQPMPTLGDSEPDLGGKGTGGGGGPCDTPGDTAKDGSRWGGRAASEKPGGRN